MTNKYKSFYAILAAFSLALLYTVPLVSLTTPTARGIVDCDDGQDAALLTVVQGTRQI